jgi:hypothetical protein
MPCACSSMTTLAAKLLHRPSSAGSGPQASSDGCCAPPGLRLDLGSGRMVPRTRVGRSALSTASSAGRGRCRGAWPARVTNRCGAPASALWLVDSPGILAGCSQPPAGGADDPGPSPAGVCRRVPHCERHRPRRHLGCGVPAPGAAQPVARAKPGRDPDQPAVQRRRWPRGAGPLPPPGPAHRPSGPPAPDRHRAWRHPGRGHPRLLRCRTTTVSAARRGRAAPAGHLAVYP